jgi:putative transcriptional regulator
MTDIVCKRKRGRPFRFSEEERTRLDGLSEAAIEAGALADPDNPPVSEERLQRMVLAREVRLTRERSGLSQVQFAVHYRIKLGRLRDFEQARTTPDFPMMAYIKLIAEHPKLAESLVERLKKEGVPG